MSLRRGTSNAVDDDDYERDSGGGGITRTDIVKNKNNNKPTPASEKKRFAALAAALVLVLGILVSAPWPASAQSSPGGACNCVIFRLDDVQDNWLDKVQVKVMEHFLEENKKLNVGVIMNHLGDDESVVDKVREGFDSGNFEIVNHGWDHVDYTNLSPQVQRNTLWQANEKIASLWGATPVTFIPPFHVYNNDTLAALRDLGMKITSSQFGLELPSIYNRGDPDSDDNKIFKAIGGSDISDSYGIYHLPQTIDFFNHGITPHEKTPVATLIDKIDDSISTYGYAVVTLHATDFAINDDDGQPTNRIDTGELDDLDQLFSDIADRGYNTETFSEVVNLGAGDGNNDGGNNSGGSNNGDGSGNGNNNNNDNGSGDNGQQQTDPQYQGGHRPIYDDNLAYFIRAYVEENGAGSLPAHDNNGNYNNNFLMGAYPINYLFTIEETHKTHDENILQWNNQYKVVTVDDGPIMNWHDLTDGQKVWLIQTFDHIHTTADVDALIADLTTAKGSGGE